MRVMRAFVCSLVVLGVVTAGAPPSLAGSPSATGTDAERAKADSYLALGDSVAAGFQPGKGKTKGYVGRVWRRMEQRIPGLTVRNVGCPGETTGSLITGKRSPCQYARGSQLKAAVAYLEAHLDKVAFITIDIGVNDLLNRCMDWQTGLLDRACAVGQRPRLKTRLTRILHALGAAAPGVPIVGMSYYDPFLGLWGLVPRGRALARADQRVFTVFNAGLRRAYRRAGAWVAGVARTFRIDDFEDTVAVAGRGRIPVNVARACRWTWFCSKRATGDPHPNWKGYRAIARTFDRKLLKLVT